MYIFLISKTDFKIKKLKWSKDIESKIDELYQLLQDPVELQLFGKETYETLAFQLYEHLVQPIAAEINSYNI